jgi:hypothetical protein
VTSDDVEEPSSGASRHPSYGFGGDKNAAIFIKRTFGVERLTRNVFDQLAIRFKYSAVGAGQMHALGVIPQCLVGYPARHCVTDLVCHQKANAILF